MGPSSTPVENADLFIGKRNGLKNARRGVPCIRDVTSTSHSMQSKPVSNVRSKPDDSIRKGKVLPGRVRG